jgi:hypothetical protein
MDWIFCYLVKNVLALEFNHLVLRVDVHILHAVFVVQSHGNVSMKLHPLEKKPQNISRTQDKQMKYSPYELRLGKSSSLVSIPFVNGGFLCKHDDRGMGK